jgi:diguanylate cyclase (GGDEF)-like protein
MTIESSLKAVAIIADDEDLGRLLLSEAAAECHLQPQAFDNGPDALQAALSQTVSIVLLDVDMPGMDGFSVCRNLRADPRFEHTPIVMVTGHEDSSAITLAFEAGATDFISKPVNWALLPRRLDYILRNAASARALAERVVQVRTLVEALPDTLWVVDANGQVRWSPTDRIDAAASALPRSLIGTLDTIRATATDGLQRKMDLRALDASGNSQSFEVRFTRREGGDVVVVRQDTSERTAAAAHIERLAYFDALTDLPNRQKCIETAEHMFEAARAVGQSVAVIYLDLNSFKRVNDSFGHCAGDEVLRVVAANLKCMLTPFLTAHPDLSLARFGGDEFVMLVRDAAARTVGMEVARACFNAFDQPILYKGLEFYSSPSMGLAVYPDDGADVGTVFKHADTAMYHAKNGSSGTVAVYTAAMSSRLRDWLDLEARLRRAVTEGLLQLHFQPKFRLDNNRIAGVEALLRWCDPEHGEVPPTRFVEIAEDSGLIIDIGSWVIRAACRHLRNWLDHGRVIPIAVNISPKELLYGDPAGVIEAEATAASVPCSLIEVEITESSIVEDSVDVRRTLERIRALGCRLALDDFGTGYSSLSYITRFPPDRIKIDKSFIQNVDRTAGDAAVASAILSLGQNLNLVVTAEGVERPGQLEWLRSRGCNEVQGFLLSHPLSAAELERRWLLPTSDQPMDGNLQKIVGRKSGSRG